MVIKILSVIYDGPIDKELDEKLIKCIEECGWEWYAQGMDMHGKRDIAFLKEEE